MPFYVWWAIPLIATLAAVAFVSWRARERAIDPHDSVAERRRFITAMEQPPAGRRSARSGAPDPADAPDAGTGSTDDGGSGVAPEGPR